MNSVKQNILQLTKCLLIFVLIFIIYFTYLQFVKASNFVHNPMNLRNSVFNKDDVRGVIYDSENRPLAKNNRIYPMNEATAHVVGYSNPDIGNSGAENYFNRELLGSTEELRKMGPIGQIFKSDEGNDLILTIDSDVSQVAYDALEGKRGGVVALDAETGAVLAMVSSPSFNPNTVQYAWESLNQSEDSPLLNRVESGLYPPGSIIKPMMVDLALENAVTDEHELFECKGVIDVGKGFTIKEAHDDVHGNLHLKEALVKSCNITFATLAIRLGAEKLENGFKRYGFYKPIRGEVFESRAHIPDFKNLDMGDTGQVGIGQSSLLVTPLRMALIAATIANNGVMMEPYILEKIISPSGKILKEHKKKELERVMLKERAGLLKNWMTEVVVNGTGKKAAVSGIEIAGKTGTAENIGDKEHSWFIGFTEIEERKIAFAILVENGGSGAEVAAPIARKIVLSLDK